MLDQAPDDVEEVLISWLDPLYRCAITRRNDDPLPFIVVRHIDGREDAESGTADHLVSIRVLCDKALGEDTAASVSLQVHRHMLELARDLPDVYLASRDRNASMDYVSVVKSPAWVECANTILCKETLFTVGLAYGPIT